MREAIQHEGTVCEVSKDLVKVRIVQQGACVSCEVRGACAASESKEKIIEIRTTAWEQYHMGDTVVLIGAKGVGMKAVLLAFVLPMVLMVAVMGICLMMGLSEAGAALGTLLTLGIYYVVLYYFRGKIAAQIQFSIQGSEGH